MISKAAMFIGLLALAAPILAEESAWQRHVIDDTSEGADGVRIADVNGDGRPDIATGWEEAGLVRIYLHPGVEQARQPWRRATVGEVKSPEDATWADLTGDGNLEVVSSCEGRERCIYVHRPKDRSDLLNTEWETAPLGDSRDHSLWMFATAIDTDGLPGNDLVVGGKGGDAVVGLFRAPQENRADFASWKLQPLRKVGWIMSIETRDFNGDGLPDILYSDRRGAQSGIHLLLNPGHEKNGESRAWKHVPVIRDLAEFMFLKSVDFDADGDYDVVAAVKNRGVVVLNNPGNVTSAWASQVIDWPDSSGSAKAVAVGDLTGDGRLEIVVSCEHATPPKSGLKWLSYLDSPQETTWQAHELSGPEGVKFDRIELVDLDEDGDLDVLTCCERPGLGVIWYENQLGEQP